MFSIKQTMTREIPGRGMTATRPKGPSRRAGARLAAFALAAAGFVVLAFPQTSFGATISTCANSSPPNDVQGTLYTSFTCSLYNDVSSYTINLTSLMEEGGANLYDNLLTPGYVVVLNGDPNVVSVGDTNDAALYNESLWEAVLYFPGDQDAGTASDSLTVYWPSAFPSASVVQTLDEGLYGSGSDSEFFVESGGFETVYDPCPGCGGNDVYDIYESTTAVPETSTWAMMLIGFGLVGFRLRRRSTAQSV